MSQSPQEWETRKEEKEMKQSAPDTLPKPLRTFSYFFFTAVVLVGVFGWFASYGR
ncbi:hypothetical protein [Paenibacillus ginsengarvi]|uniref:hypothetical protein n=1 Tax=Paenibacillus ginsengarvi TaxID=400777 RepID=UPI0013158F06|nr:hypothetical protein [Paenibacillus ginsengarvi]